MFSIYQQKQYLESERAKLMQGEHQGKKLSTILGVKFPCKVAISRSFIKNDDKKNNIIQQLIEKKREIMQDGMVEYEAMKFIRRDIVKVDGSKIENSVVQREEEIENSE